MKAFAEEFWSSARAFIPGHLSVSTKKSFHFHKQTSAYDVFASHILSANLRVMEDPKAHTGTDRDIDGYEQRKFKFRKWGAFDESAEMASPCTLWSEND